MRDSYERFFANGYMNKKDFIAFGLNETIYAPFEQAEKEWEDLKLRVHSNQSVYIRGFGRDAAGTHLFLSFYEKLLGNNGVKKDPNNNSRPTKLISRLTGYSKTVNSKFEPIRNYQVSHVFGRTKNIYAFTAPWNIVYMPKLLDPFTGHEATGSMVSEFTLLFQRQSYALFGKLIDDFNELISCPKFLARMSACMGELQGDQTIEQSDFRKFEQAVKEEFRPIVIA